MCAWRACLHSSAAACLILQIFADHAGGAARCHAVRVVRASPPLRPCWPSGHSREQEVAGEYPYVLARKVWLYPFWAGRWPPNRSNLLPPWLEGDRLDRTAGAYPLGAITGSHAPPVWLLPPALTRHIVSRFAEHLSMAVPVFGRDLGHPTDQTLVTILLGFPPGHPSRAPPLGVCNIRGRRRVSSFQRHPGTRGEPD